MKRHQTDMDLAELAMYKEYGLKPNFSELSRKTGLDPTPSGNTGGKARKSTRRGKGKAAASSLSLRTSS